MQNLSTTYRDDIRDRDETYIPASHSFTALIDYLARLEALGRPADYIAVQRVIYRVVRSNISALPNRAVRRITGAPASTFRECAERERQSWVPDS